MFDDIEDDIGAYALDDPKHPTFHERYAGIWDDRDKTTSLRPRPGETPEDTVDRVVDAVQPRSHSKQKATITKPGIPGREEPSAKLADGRTMPMGRNMGQTIEVGTTGTAEYIYDGRSGLWLFTP